MLVWEESLGWGNGQGYTSRHDKVSEPEDAGFCDMQEKQTREMVRASFNHPSVIIYGFLNECASDKPVVKALVDRLIATIRKEDSGRLVTFACNKVDEDISCENVDLVSINASPSTEDFQDEYLRDILTCLWANPHCSGYAIWQMNDGRTRERFWSKNCSTMFGGSVAGCFDEMRRPKKSVATVKAFFEKKGRGRRRRFCGRLWYNIRRAIRRSEQIPYGVKDFKRIRLENRYYVDKTAFIRKMEERADFLFFVRPRRFGKSLLCETLRCYYDVAEKENFERLFGDLDIGL